MKTYHVNRYGHRFVLTVEDAIMETHYQKGELCEWHMLDWIEKHIPRGGVWIDAGANIGNHTMPFSLWADTVVAFEPMPVNFDLLLQNIDRTDGLGPIMPFMLGVGHRPEWVGAKKGGTGQNCQWILGEGEGRLQVVAIDAIIPRDQYVRLIKLDVEGMEDQSIAGAMETILRCRPELFIEIWEDEVLSNMRASLAQWGYTLIERWNVAPTYHFSASGRYPVTYTPPPNP